MEGIGGWGAVSQPECHPGQIDSLSVDGDFVKRGAALEQVKTMLNTESPFNWTRFHLFCYSFCQPW